MSQPKDPSTVTERRKMARQVRRSLQIYLIWLDSHMGERFPDTDISLTQLACLVEAQHDLSELIDAQKEAMQS